MAPKFSENCNGSEEGIPRRSTVTWSLEAVRKFPCPSNEIRPVLTALASGMSYFMVPLDTEGVTVRDLGPAQMKDIQHEHVFELALDESSRSFPPLKTPLTGEAAFEKRFDDKIERYVERQLDAALSGSPTAQVKYAVGGLATLVLVVAAIVAIVFLVKLVV